jgi:hypothetical protein
MLDSAGNSGDGRMPVRMQTVKTMLKYQKKTRTSED